MWPRDTTAAITGWERHAHVAGIQILANLLLWQAELMPEREKKSIRAKHEQVATVLFRFKLVP